MRSGRRLLVGNQVSYYITSRLLESYLANVMRTHRRAAWSRACVANASSAESRAPSSFLVPAVRACKMPATVEQGHAPENDQGSASGRLAAEELRKIPPRRERIAKLRSRSSLFARFLAHLTRPTSSMTVQSTIKVLVTGLDARFVPQPAAGGSTSGQAATTQELVLPLDATLADVYTELRASGKLHGGVLDHAARPAAQEKAHVSLQVT